MKTDDDGNRAFRHFSQRSKTTNSDGRQRQLAEDSTRERDVAVCWLWMISGRAGVNHVHRALDDGELIHHHAQHRVVGRPRAHCSNAVDDMLHNTHAISRCIGTTYQESDCLFGTQKCLPNWYMVRALQTSSFKRRASIERDFHRRSFMVS